MDLQAYTQYRLIYCIWYWSRIYLNVYNLIVDDAVLEYIL